MTSAAKDEKDDGCDCNIPEYDGICLGDEFSRAWMDIMDEERKGTLESLFHLYNKVRSTMGHNHPQMYGDYALGKSKLTPNKDGRTSSKLVNMKKTIASLARSAQKGVLFSYTVAEQDVIHFRFILDPLQTCLILLHHHGLCAVPSDPHHRDIPLHYLKQKVSLAKSTSEMIRAQNELDEVLRGRKIADLLFEDLVAVPIVENAHLRTTISSEHLPLNKDVFPCYEELLENFRTQCFGFENTYFFSYFYKLANICIAGLDTTELINRMGAICAPYKASIKTRIV